MKRLNGAREVYSSIPIPQELQIKVEEAFSIGKRRRERSAVYKRIFQSGGCCLAALSLLFILLVNVNPVFAESVSGIPVLGALSRVCTFVEFEEEDESAFIHVRIPELKNTGSTGLEQKINAQIVAHMENLLDDARIEARENWEAYLETGGDPDQYVPMYVNLDYEVKQSSEETVSFVIWIDRTRANAYRECKCYNYIFETGQEITLENLLGKDWQNIASASIRTQMRQREAEGGETLYFRTEKGEYAFSQIAEDAEFYLNASGNPVIVFNKYEIGYGFIGEQEFEIFIEEKY